MTDEPVRTPESLLEAVSEQAERLDKAATGAVRRLFVRWGEAAVEVEWDSGQPENDRRTELDDAVISGTMNGEPAAINGSSHARSYIRAPMVGTFYRSASPAEKPLVEVGDHVEPGQQVGVLETLKLMNPIAADEPGQIVEILVPDATAVEYEQPLIAVARSDEQ